MLLEPAWHGVGDPVEKVFALLARTARSAARGTQPPRRICAVVSPTRYQSANSYLVTLVERQTRYLMLAKIANRDTHSVVTALIKQAKQLPEELYRSLTWDRATELTDHKRFTLATDVAAYFCDPQSPWQRGSNENANRLLRQYFPKRTDLSGHSQARLNKMKSHENRRT
jgi:IS30 family transposase